MLHMTTLCTAGVAHEEIVGMKNGKMLGNGAGIG
jgi:hypothetical protein